MADAECQHLGVLIKRGGGRQRAIKTSECQAVRYDDDRRTSVSRQVQLRQTCGDCLGLCGTWHLVLSDGMPYGKGRCWYFGERESRLGADS